MLIDKFIPNIIEKTIYDINFSDIYASGKRYILTDLDNTIIPYDLDFPNEKIKKWFDELNNLGFKVLIVSNNHKERVSKFANSIGADYIYSAKKPLKFGLKKALKIIKNKYHNELKLDDIKKKTITLGDQLMTDVFGSNRIKIDSILVHPIKKKSEHWYTKVNRKLEQHVIKKIKKKYPNIYKEIKEKHEY